MRRPGPSRRRGLAEVSGRERPAEAAPSTRAFGPRRERPHGKVEENFTPVGRLCDNGSTFLCVPNALSREGGYALGAQAGPAAIRELTTKAEFAHFRQVVQTAFDLVYEIRP